MLIPCNFDAKCDDVNDYDDDDDGRARARRSENVNLRQASMREIDFENETTKEIKNSKVSFSGDSRECILIGLFAFWPYTEMKIDRIIRRAY